jgi:hypothetical protein
VDGDAWYNQEEALELDVNGTSENYSRYGSMNNSNDGFTLSGKAAENGDLELLKWLHMHNFNCFDLELFEEMVTPPYAAVACNGHNIVLEWLHEQGAELNTPQVCEGAARGGHIHILEWIVQLGHDLHDSDDMTYYAFETGRLPVLQWLVQQGLDVGDSCDAGVAAENGHLAVLQWMTERGIDLTGNDRLCTEAAGGGHLAVLQWLHTIGCPMDVPECTAKVRDSIDTNATCEQSSTFGSPMERHEEVLNWLREFGGEYRAAQTPACRQGHAEEHRPASADCYLCAATLVVGARGSVVGRAGSILTYLRHVPLSAAWNWNTGRRAMVGCGVAVATVELGSSSSGLRCLLTRGCTAAPQTTCPCCVERG